MTMSLIDDNPRTIYLTERIRRDLNTVLLMAEDAVFEFITDSSDIRVIPEDEEALDRVAQRLSKVINGGGSLKADLLRVLRRR